MRSNIADLILQRQLITADNAQLNKDLEMRAIRYNGAKIDAKQFKNILESNLKSAYPQYLSELFTGNTK